MEPEDQSVRCRSSSDVPLLPLESKDVDIRMYRHVDPRYSVYRWDCGSYPYFKAPLPTSSPCSGAQTAFPANNLRHPGHHVPTAPDTYCDGRRDCYAGVVVGGGPDFLPQPQHCICPDPRDSPYHPPHPGPDALSWESRPAGCLCCGQHVVSARGPSTHHPPRHVDSVRFFPPVYRTTGGPDVAHVYPSAPRESIVVGARQTDATPVQCLSSESLGLGVIDQRTERLSGCTGQATGQTSSSSCTRESVSTEENREVRRSIGGPEGENDDKRCCSATKDPSLAADQVTVDAMTNIGSLPTTEEIKRSDRSTGKNQDAKITPTRSASKVTPLYGLPSWWGDEPEPDFSQQIKYNHPTATPSPFSDPPTLQIQTENSGRVVLATARSSLGNSSSSSSPHPAMTKGCSLGPTRVPTIDYSQPPITGQGDAQGPRHIDLGNCQTIFENPGLRHKSDSKSSPHTENSFEISSFIVGQTHFESPNAGQNLKISGHHSPPERDRPSTTDGELQHFLYPDPFLPVPVDRDLRVVTYRDDGSPLKCKAPTAFIVDLQEIDNDNRRRRITVKTSLRQFLPPRCERSLQRRLSWMKQNRKIHSATERGEGRTENENRGDDIVTTDTRSRFPLSQPSSFKDSFEEVVASDVIADDVSEAGTYTIDVSSDGESVAVADARDRILATFGITGIEDAELDKGKWLESGKDFFETDWDKDCSKNDESLASKTNRRPTTLGDNDGVDGGVSKSNGNADPVTPTAESCTWSFSEVLPAPLISKNHVAAQDDIVLTIYTEAAAGCLMTGSEDQPECHIINLNQDVKEPSRRLRGIDSTVPSLETDWSSKSRMACEKWRTESTMNVGHLLLGSETVDSRPSYHSSTEQRTSTAEVCLPLESNKAVSNGSFLSTTLSAATEYESGRLVLPTDRDYFKIPASSYSGPVSSLRIGIRSSGSSDTETLEPGFMLRRRSTTTASESADSLESPRNKTSDSTASGHFMPTDEALRTCATSNKRSLLFDPEKNSDGTLRRERSNGIPTNAVGLPPDFDEDGSSVDPLHDLVPIQTLAVFPTEITLKPAEESEQVLVNKKSLTTRKYVEENRKTGHQSTFTESESPPRHGDISGRKPLASSSGLKTQVTSPLADKPGSSKHPKTKPPTPKSFPKSPSLPDGQLSSRRCFSDLDVADHDDAGSATGSPVVASDGKGTVGGKGSSVEHTRMNRTFALRCARREASDGGMERLDNPQRSTRTTKKSSSSKFDDVQRSRSASRSRPGGASPRSLFKSPRSAEAGINAGQRGVRKSQEKVRQTSTAHGTSSSNTVTRSLIRDDESTSQKSSAVFRPPNATRTTKKKGPTSDSGKEDVVDGTSGLAMKGSPVQSRPLSSSLPLQEPVANEWTRRKKYNPRQSLQTDVSPKKTGKSDGKPILTNVDKTDTRPRNRKKATDPAAVKNSPSTPSDWTDDEKLQLTPRGRDLPAVCQLSAKVKLLSDQVLQALRKRPEFKVNEVILQSSKQASSDTDSLENTSPEFLYIFHNLEAAERQMSAVFKVLSMHN